MAVHLYLDMSAGQIEALPEPELDLAATTVVHVIDQGGDRARRCQAGELGLLPGDDVILHANGDDQFIAHVEDTDDYGVVIALD